MILNNPDVLKDLHEAYINAPFLKRASVRRRFLSLDPRIAERFEGMSDAMREQDKHAGTKCLVLGIVIVASVTAIIVESLTIEPNSNSYPWSCFGIIIGGTSIGFFVSSCENWLKYRDRKPAAKG